MLNLVKKVWNFVADLYTTVTTGQEVRPAYGNAQSTTTVKGPEYWAEVAEQERIRAAAEEYHAQRERMAHLTTQESLRTWRENDRAVTAYFQKKAAARRKSHLRIVTSA